MPVTLLAMSQPIDTTRRILAGLLGCLLVATASGGGPVPRPAAVEPAAVEPVAAESVASAAVRAAEEGAAAAGYRWPLDGRVEVVRPFDPPTRRWHPGHRGVDLAAGPEAVVRAAGAGVVRFAGPVADRGVVSIDHAGGLRSTYEPVTPTVSAGDPVAAGDPIGVLVAGHAGCPREACLHWGLRRAEFYLDPLTLLGLGRARLLPPSPPPI